MRAWAQPFVTKLKEWYGYKMEIDSWISSIVIGGGISMALFTEWDFIASGLICSGSLGYVFSIKRQSVGRKIDNMQTSNNKFLERMEERDKKYEERMKERDKKYEERMKERDKKYEERMKVMLEENNRRFGELKSAIVNLTNAITAASKDGRQQGSETG